MHLLNIQSLTRGKKSASIVKADAFVKACRSQNADLIVDTLNVWEEHLSEFDQEGIGAKYKGVKQEPMDAHEAAVWVRIQKLAQRFQAANRMVLGVPMWNFAYPYKLKPPIDLVCQRDLLCTYDGEHYGPLLQVERTLVIYARALRRTALGIW